MSLIGSQRRMFQVCGIDGSFTKTSVENISQSICASRPPRQLTLSLTCGTRHHVVLPTGLFYSCDESLMGKFAASYHINRFHVMRIGMRYSVSCLLQPIEP